MGVFDPALGADDEFQRVQLIAIQYVPLFRTIWLWVRADGAAIFGDAPFYLRPFITLRGAPIMRYQGDEVAQVEAESPLAVLESLQRGGLRRLRRGVERLRTTAQYADDRDRRGFGVRYEIARKYGIHMGIDLAFAPDNTAVYIQVGSAWARP